MPPAARLITADGPRATQRRCGGGPSLEFHRTVVHAPKPKHREVLQVVLIQEAHKYLAAARRLAVMLNDKALVAQFDEGVSTIQTH